MANYKLKYSGEKIDELLTKIDNLGAGTDAKSGTVKLSSATDSDSGVSDGVAATPKAVKDAYDAAVSVNDTVADLSKKVEKNTNSISKNNEAVNQIKGDMDTKANKSDVLSLEEIQASTDLSGKIASASSVNELCSATTLFSDYVTSGNTYTIPDISNFKLIEITNNYYNNALFSFVCKPELNVNFFIHSQDIDNTNAIILIIVFTSNTTFKIIKIDTHGAWVIETLIIRGYK